MKRRDLTHAERVAIVERHMDGATLDAIAESLDLNLFTVRHWWRVYRDGGWSALAPTPKGPPQRGALGRFDPRVKYVALRLKREHPGCGLPILRLHMQRRPSLAGIALPKNTVLWSYLHQFGSRLLTPRRLPTQRPESRAVRAEAAHQCWEMDFKGDEIVQGCQVIVCPFGVTDEATGAPLLRVMHTIQVRGNHQGLTRVKYRLICGRHSRHGVCRMPSAWIATRSLSAVPTSIGPVRSCCGWLAWASNLSSTAPIGRPTMRWSSARTRPGAVMCLRERRSAMSRPCRPPPIKPWKTVAGNCRRGHPGCAGRAPAVACPDLLCARHPFQVDRERQLFDLARVDAYLAHWEWRRPVDSAGKISLASRNQYISKRYLRQVVKLRFDPATREVICALASDEIVARLTLVELTAEYILGQGV